MIYDKSTESLFQLVSQKNISNSIFEKSVVGYPVVIYFLYSDYMYNNRRTYQPSGLKLHSSTTTL